jgi:endonuclease/exonuclease/phosphatase family metal-dependent hydrolase
MVSLEKGAFIRPLPLSLLLLGSLGLVYPHAFAYLLNSNPVTGVAILAVGIVVYSTRRRREPFAPLTARDLEAGVVTAPTVNPDTLVIKNTALEVKALTYNVYLRPPLVNSNGEDYKNERLREFAKVIPQFDILCLQEVFALGNSRQARLISAARRYNFHHVTSVPPPLISSKFVDAGLVILSKYPIVSSDGHIFNHGNQIDFYTAKQVLYAKVQLALDSFVHVFTAHLQASYYENADQVNQLNDEARTHQLQEMIDFARVKALDTEHPILLTGDFNLPALADSNDLVSESEAYQDMMMRLHTAFPRHEIVDLLKESYGGTHPFTYGDAELGPDGILRPKEVVLTSSADYNCRLAIDYLIWISPPLAPTVSDHRVQMVPGSTRVEVFPVTGHRFEQLSDHYGVSTVIGRA